MAFSENEAKTAGEMVRLYCRGRHGSGSGLCPGCAALLAYAEERLSRCPHSPKPSCRACRTHCYSPLMRERMREVMRYSGPRMALRRPLIFLRHWLSGRGKKT